MIDIRPERIIFLVCLLVFGGLLIHQNRKAGAVLKRLDKVEKEADKMRKAAVKYEEAKSLVGEIGQRNLKINAQLKDALFKSLILKRNLVMAGNAWKLRKYIDQLNEKAEQLSKKTQFSPSN